MLILRSSPASPFGRKVKIAAVDPRSLRSDPGRRCRHPRSRRIRSASRTRSARSRPWSWRTARRSTIPASSSIISTIWPAEAGSFPTGRARFAALREQALATASWMRRCCRSTRAAIARRRSGASRNGLDHQADKVTRGLDHAEAHLSEPARSLHVGHIALACALGYLDLRFTAAGATAIPKLVAWLDDFASRVPAFEKTRVNAVKQKRPGVCPGPFRCRRVRQNL